MDQHECGSLSREHYISNPLLAPPAISVSALTSASASRFEPIKKQTLNRPLFHWIDMIRPADDRPRLFEKRKRARAGNPLDSAKAQDQL
jgi:hypothetical protein